MEINNIKDGVVVLDKPSGMSSFLAVKLVGRAVGTKKVGHMGTLDPLASGVLVVGINKGTKLFDKFLHMDKEYYAEYRFGSETDTLDLEGEIINQNDVIVTKEMLEEVLPKFIGKQNQMPPIYSAKKINGKRACDLAREGKSVTLMPKEIEVFSLTLDKELGNNTFGFSIHCSSGFYVRALGRDIALNLGTFATTTCIRRTKCCGFSLKDAQTLEEIKAGNAKIYEIKEQK